MALIWLSGHAFHSYARYQIKILEILEFLIGNFIVGEIQIALVQKRAAIIGFEVGLINDPRAK